MQFLPPFTFCHVLHNFLAVLEPIFCDYTPYYKSYQPTIFIQTIGKKNVHLIHLVYILSIPIYANRNNPFLFQATMNEWRIVFWLGFVILVVSSIIFAIWGTADVQPYDPSYTGEKKQ